MAKIALAFSKPIDFPDIFSPLGAKRVVYEELVDKLEKNGHEAYVVSTKTYKGDGLFEGYWKIKPNKAQLFDGEVKIDVVYDRSGGLKFPRQKDNLRVVDNISFKKICWNKWLAYKELYNYMPGTYWVGIKENLGDVLKEIKGNMVVLKPHNGLKGRGVYIGSKDGARKHKFDKKLPEYIAQEFVDTSGGISGITDRTHDLRVVIINKKIVWVHVRVPPKGQLKANIGVEGATLTEVDANKLPERVKQICGEIAEIFHQKYDSPIYSLDFGVDTRGTPYLFEVNDQMGFPRPEMKARDLFISEIVKNLESKLL